jgi:hypothetical protein
VENIKIVYVHINSEIKRKKNEQHASLFGLQKKKKNKKKKKWMVDVNSANKNGIDDVNSGKKL